MTPALNKYIIQKDSWPRYGRLHLLWQSMAGNRLRYLAGLLALIAEAFCTFCSPIVLKLTIDSVIGTQAPMIPAPLLPLATALLGPNLQGGGILGSAPASANTAGAWAWHGWLKDNLWAMGVAFAVIIGFQALFSFLANYLANSAAENAAKQMRDRLYGHVQSLPWESLLRAQSGDWLQRCTSDVDTTRRFVGFELFEICRTLFLVALALPVMLSLNVGLTLWGSLVIPVILAFSIVFHRIVEKVFLGVDEREGILSGIVQENVTGVRVVRAFARQEYERGRFGHANDRFRDQLFRLIFWLALYWGVSSFLGLVQVGIVLGAGLSLLETGVVSIGLIVLFLTYEQQILWPIRQFGRLLADAGKTKVALGRMAELLALCEEAELYEGAAASTHDWSRGSIEFDHVSFTYPDGTKVLHDVSFRIESGAHLAIVGPTGSGKSSLVHLLLRLYEPDSGTIRIGGVDIRSIPKALLRSRIALVLQEGFLFGKTVRENIRLGKPEAAEHQVSEAARSAHFHQVVEGLGESWETMVGERGVTLSGGQQQRLALARALVRETPVLILDDSLSAVDTETDARIRSSLRRRESGAATTTIIIAHRLTTLASADQILVLESGRISDMGTHGELIARPGLYQRLAQLQNDEALTAKE